MDILIGASAHDIRFTETATLESTLELPGILTRESTIRDWLADKHGRAVFEQVFKNMQAQMGATFGAELDDKEKKAMDMTAFMIEMPLISILDFQEKFLPMPAEDMVDELLRQANSR